MAMKAWNHRSSSNIRSRSSRLKKGKLNVKRAQEIILK